MSVIIWLSFETELPDDHPLITNIDADLQTFIPLPTTTTTFLPDALLTTIVPEITTITEIQGLDIITPLEEE